MKDINSVLKIPVGRCYVCAAGGEPYKVSQSQNQVAFFLSGMLDEKGGIVSNTPVVGWISCCCFVRLGHSLFLLILTCNSHHKGDKTMQISSNIKWLLHACIIATVCTVIGACAMGRRGMEVRRIEPHFDYNPSTDATAGETGITFAAVGSQFEIPFGQSSVPLFERFADNMADDFGEIITARGYTLRGPFHTFDDMTFIDKDNSNLILTAKVDFKSDLSGTNVLWYKPFMNPGSYIVSGNVKVLCRVSLIISEV